jgi:MbtH protein
MSSEPTEARFRVVRNGEDQYSIWFPDRALPEGWLDAGIEGSKEECLARIGELWTDMRPRSLREALDVAEGG